MSRYRQTNWRRAGPDGDALGAPFNFEPLAQMRHLTGVVGLLQSRHHPRLSVDVAGVVVRLDRIDDKTWTVATGAAVDLFDNQFQALDAWFASVERQHGWADYQSGAIRDEFDRTRHYSAGLAEAARFPDEYAAAAAVDAAQRTPYQEELK